MITLKAQKLTNKVKVLSCVCCWHSRENSYWLILYHFKGCAQSSDRHHHSFVWMTDYNHCINIISHIRLATPCPLSEFWFNRQETSEQFQQGIFSREWSWGIYCFWLFLMDSWLDRNGYSDCKSLNRFHFSALEPKVRETMNRTRILSKSNRWAIWPVLNTQTGFRSNHFDEFLIDSDRHLFYINFKTFLRIPWCRCFL